MTEPTEPTEPGWAAQPAPTGPPPGSFPGQTAAPPPGSFPGQPPPPPAGGLPPYAPPVPPPVPKRRGRTVVVLAGLVVVAAAGAFAVTQLGGGDGAASPEEAVETMFGAIADEDLLGVLEALSPGERRTLLPTVETLADELERLGILDDAVALDDISGVDITIADLELESDELTEGIAAVTVTGGSARFESVPDDLPIGDNLRSLIEESGGAVDDTEVSDENDLGDENIELVAVEEDGGWHVSLFYTLAEVIRNDADLDLPDFSAGVEPEGADSAEAAVEAMLRSAVDLDLESVIAGLAPDEAGALQDYAPLFLPDVEAGVADLADSVELALDELELSSEGADEGATRVTLDAFRLSVGIPDEGDMVVDFDGECVSFEVDGEPAPLDLFGTGEDEGEDELCVDDAAGAGLFGSLSGAASGFITVEIDGSHFVSATRTAFDGVLQLVAALDTEDLEDPEALFDLLLGDLALGAGPDFGELEDLEDLDDFDGGPDVAPGDAAPPTGLGDDPEYQPMAEDCFDGDLGACDDLYLASPVGSDYERYAQTCGGRLAEEDAVYGGCAARFGDPGTPGDGGSVADPLEPEAPPTPSDPAFRSLVDACFTGDMQACDDAYYESDIDTPEEAYGRSCGGRRSEAETFEDCVVQFGPTVVD